MKYSSTTGSGIECIGRRQGRGTHQPEAFYASFSFAHTSLFKTLALLASSIVHVLTASSKVLVTQSEAPQHGYVHTPDGSTKWETHARAPSRLPTQQRQTFEPRERERWRIGICPTRDMTDGPGRSSVHATTVFLQRDCWDLGQPFLSQA